MPTANEKQLQEFLVRKAALAIEQRKYEQEANAQVSEKISQIIDLLKEIGELKETFNLNIYLSDITDSIDNVNRIGDNNWNSSTC